MKHCAGKCKFWAKQVACQPCNILADDSLSPSCTMDWFSKFSPKKDNFCHSPKTKTMDWISKFSPNKPEVRCRELDIFKILEIYGTFLGNFGGNFSEFWGFFFWIFESFFWKFFGNFLEYFFRNFLGIVHREFFGNSLWNFFGILCENLLESLRNWFVCQDFGFCQDFEDFVSSTRTRKKEGGRNLDP